MSTLSTPVVLYCERCRRRTPHSQRGKCLELHRTKRLHYTKPADELARWHAVKAQVFERDGYACVRCGDTGPLDCHHRRIKGAGGVSDDEWEYGRAGLLTLCRICHDWIHTCLGHPSIVAGSHRDDMERLGFIIPRFPPDVEPSEVPVLTTSGWVRLLDDGSKVSVGP